MHLITLRIISNISVLVIAATLSTVGAVGASQGALRVTGATGALWLAKGNWPVGQILLKGNTLLVGPETVPAVAQRRFPAGEKWEKKKPGYNGLG